MFQGAEPIEHFARQPPEGVCGARAWRGLEDGARGGGGVLQCGAGGDLGVEDVLAVLGAQAVPAFESRRPRQLYL